MTFVALAFRAWLLGRLGAILAVPVTLLLKALLVDIDPHAHRADALLKGYPAPTSQTRRSDRSAAGTASFDRAEAGSG